MATTHRNTAQRDRDRKTIARNKPPCGICGAPIDYTLPYLDPMSYVVDHIVPYSKGGIDHVDNKQATHRICNRLKSDKTDKDEAPQTFITHRSW